jgi:hypothetical protein
MDQPMRREKRRIKGGVEEFFKPFRYFDSEEAIVSERDIRKSK